MEQNRFKRLWQHWLCPRFRVERYFPTVDLQRISSEIGRSEQNHQGQIRFVIESRYPSSAVLGGLNTRTRAWQWFGELGVWDTEMNSGVLVYISFADHAVEIVADRGIAGKVGTEAWQHVCETMREAFKNGAFVAGLESGLREVNTILSRHLPRDPRDGAVDELPNEVVLR
ncbi:TPM domain-containing protein [Neisseria animaloris]|uniref:TPM domain-containing protein n=1 Tax=Neisseria animaloris TaxID=326522 RepID=UPI000D358FF5|nr:TPM domain-containing protein [Neisseria animaloris]